MDDELKAVEDNKKLIQLQWKAKLAIKLSHFILIKSKFK
jgi:hypothetical protein